jgi:peptide chain release factor subunit 1
LYSNFNCLINNINFDIIGRGGQSALRFARLRMEKRHNYVRKVAEVATQLFITNDKPNISGLILAGSADFKTELNQSDMFDPVCHSILIAS